MKKRNAIIVAVIVAIGLSLGGRALISSDSAVKSKVMMLTGNNHQCSGEQVRAPSGVDYILTAAHCASLADKDGNILIRAEDGRVLKRRIIAEDPNSDLLLLEGMPGLRGLDIADSSGSGKHVRTFTHGSGMATYKTEGTLIETKRIQVMLDMITTPAERAACLSKPKNRVVEDMTMFGPIAACILDVEETFTTAMIVPGSSGGEVVDDSGRLVGVVSAGDGHFGALVALKHIKHFLHNY